MKGVIRKIFSMPFAIRRMENKIDDLMILAARNYMRSFDMNSPLPSIQDAEYKVFSQWGDDGIIQYLVRKLAIEEKTFIEFGVENYKEANTRFLLVNNNWKGLIFDGSEDHIKQIKTDDIYWRHNLTAVPAFITRENINDLIRTNNFEGALGLLHIDIDGNDYWVWDAISVVEPAIVIMEYNAYFGDKRSITIPYKPDFYTGTAHYSRIYFGASLPALVHLAEKKGYFHIGCNSNGNNAYFLHNRYAGQFKALTAAEGFVMPQFRQTRDQQGQLSFLEGEKALNLIKGLPITNVITGETEQL